MARQRTRGRANGPYRRGNRWRVVIRQPGGRTITRSYGTEEYARRIVESYNEAVEGITTSDAIEGYRRHLNRKGNKPRSVATTMHRLAPLKLAGGELRRLRKRRLEQVLDGVSDAVDTRKGVAGEWRTFFRWCMREGLVGHSPAEDLRVEGRRRHGKPQLRLDEARALMAYCLAVGDEAATATLCALLLGMRASEIVERVDRDLDDGGRLLWIDEAKTEAGRRFLEVPDVLRPLLKARAARGGELFPGRSRYWLRDQVMRLCREAKVREVSPHGLRGTHATLATDAGATGAIVAGALGDATLAVVERHYIAAGASERQQQARALRVLDGGKGERKQDSTKSVSIAAESVSEQRKAE